MIRAYSATRLEDLMTAEAYSKEAIRWLDNVPENVSQPLRGTITLNLGQILGGLDEINKAKSAFEKAIEDSKATPRVSAVMAAYTEWALLERRSGQLAAANEIVEQGLSWLDALDEQKSQEYPSEGELRIQKALIKYEQNQLKAARDHLNRCLFLYKTTSYPRYIECLHYLFQIEIADGHVNRAIELHEEINPVFKNLPLTRFLRHLGACIDRLLCLSRIQPDEDRWSRELANWIPQFKVEKQASANTRIEPQLLVQSKILNVTDSPEESLVLLAYLADTAESAGRFGDLIQYRVQQALVLYSLAQLEPAVEYLQEAISLAEPERYMRTFLDEGKKLKELLHLLPKTLYRDEILAHIVQEDHTISVQKAGKTTGQVIIEPLSDREIEVLALLVSHLTGPEIAERLSISINTYKTHSKNIYTKLGVNNRNDAVMTAKELGLL
jgi:LuxR family maltose regulon positive regulatory protein